MPSLTTAERRFLDRWNSIDFAAWSEAEVREGFVVDLLDTLGYQSAPPYDLPAGSLGGPAPSIAKRHFWLIETRPGTPREMPPCGLPGLRRRAFSPEVRARFVVLANGWQVRVYDALTVSDFDDAVLIVNQGDGANSLIRLRETIGSAAMLELHRARMLDIVRSTLSSETDTLLFDEQAARLREVLTEAKRAVVESARALKTPGWKERLAEGESTLFSMSIEMLFVRMDLPWDGRPPPAREFTRRVLQAVPEERARLLELLALEYRARPHNVFRVQALGALVALLHGGVEVPPSAHLSGVRESINELALHNMSYWAPESSPPLCHLDNVACRVAMKLCLRVGTAHFKRVPGLGAPWTRSERGSSAPEVEFPGHEIAAHLHELLWRWSSRAECREQMLEGLWDLHAIEAELDRLPPRPGSRSVEFYGHQSMGLSWDQLRTGTVNVVRDQPGLPTGDGIDPRVLEYARMTRRQVTEGIPPEPRAPHGRRPGKGMAEALDCLAAAVRIRAAETAEKRW